MEIDNKKRQKIFQKLQRRMSPGKREELINNLERQRIIESQERNKKRFYIIAFMFITFVCGIICGYSWCLHHMGMI